MICVVFFVPVVPGIAWEFAVLSGELFFVWPQTPLLLVEHQQGPVGAPAVPLTAAWHPPKNNTKLNSKTVGQSNIILNIKKKIISSISCKMPSPPASGG